MKPLGLKKIKLPLSTLWAMSDERRSALLLLEEGGRGTGQISGESEANGIADASLRDRTESKVPSLAREETNEERNRRS
jgi:hypothetical protein